MTRPTTHEGWLALAEKLDGEAQGNDQKAEESFQRSDTDGFLSQWALGIGAQMRRRQAEIARNDGLAEFWQLYEGDRRVDAKLVRVANKWRGGHDRVWRVADSDPVAAKRKWVPDGPKSRVQKALGLTEKREMAPAWARIEGEGKGLSGNAWVATYRVDEG